MQNIASMFYSYKVKFIKKKKEDLFMLFSFKMLLSVNLP